MYTLLETPGASDLQSKSFLTDDPALIVLYAQLRQKTLQTLRGASKVTPKVEWDFVLHNARLYDRMGCDLLGLDLGESESVICIRKKRTTANFEVQIVRNWEFLKPPPSAPAGLGGEINPLTLLKRRSSLVVVDMPVPSHVSSPVVEKAMPLQQVPAEMKSGHGTPSTPHKPKPPPTVFEEPDANSLLDSFGF